MKLAFCDVSRALAATCVVASATLVTAPAQAEPVRAFVTANLNQRAGPNTRFPVVRTVPKNNPVTIFGCLSDLNWCDGAFENTRGWFSARYLTFPYASSYLTTASYVRYAYLPTVSFRINSYWDRYYRDRPFYAQLAFYSSGGSVNVSVGSFYRPLAPHGSWTEVRGRNVWVPRVDADWRPYTNGRWVYTRRHGWTWVSNEPFGWATDHYGRWGYSARVGWFWVPGTQWAPAWVAWRKNPDYVAWAPIPPDPEDSFGVSFQISFGNIPNYYWRPVRSRDFYADDAANVIIGDNNTIINIVNQTEPAGTVQVENNVVVNNVIDVNYVEQQTGETVVAKEIALTSSEAENGQTTGETVELYHPPESELAPTAAPEQVVSEEVVASESATVGQAGDQPATEDLVPPEPQPDQAPPQEVATEAPSFGGEGAEQPSGDQGPPPAVDQGPPPAGVEACPEGTVRQQDGNCAEPAAEAPPAEEVTPETATEPAVPPQAEPGQPPVLPPPQAGPDQAPVPELPAPPAAEAQPTAPPALPTAEPCAAGTVRLQDGSCGAPAAEAPPAEQVTPETATEPAAPSPQAAPAQPVPELPAPPAGEAQPTPPSAPPAAEPCPAGTVRQQDGSCGAPVPQASPMPEPQPVPELPPAPPAPQQAAPPAPPQAPPAPEPLQAPPPPEPPQAPPPPPEPQQSAPQPEPPPPPPEPPQAPPPPEPPQAAPVPPPPPPEPPQQQQAAPPPPEPPQAPPAAEPPPPPEPQQSAPPPANCPEGQVPDPQGGCVPQ